MPQGPLPGPPGDLGRRAHRRVEVPPDVYAQRTFLPDRRRDRGVVTGRTRARVDRAVHQLGRKASGIVADAADLGAMDALVGTVRDRHGRLDSLFANAGTGTFLPFENITEPDFDHGIDVDFKGVLFTVQKALPLPADGGSIVINAPWTLHRGNSVLTLYSATRAACRRTQVCAEMSTGERAEQAAIDSRQSPGR